MRNILAYLFWWGKNKIITFNAIKEKLGKVLAGWKEKLLLKGGERGSN